MMAAAQIGFGSWLLASGAYLAFRRKPWVGDVLTMVGILAGVLFLGSLWATLGRPPMRTLGETRWWYAVASPLLGLLMAWRFDARMLVIPSCLMGAMFAGINLAHPEAMDKTLMPALQSPWFVPHVVVYLLAYAALGTGSVAAAWELGSSWIQRRHPDEDRAAASHRMVLIGFPLLTCGLIFGAFWAKEAWGHYWTWDPKETWALITWGAYLAYIHVRSRHALKTSLNLAVLALGFAALMACWFGVNYLPTAKESVHTYTQPE
jgi:ABC-type transport system involved in cytochrome c biogenesis permease subunit